MPRGRKAAAGSSSKKPAAVKNRAESSEDEEANFLPPAVPLAGRSLVPGLPDPPPELEEDLLNVKVPPPVQPAMSSEPGEARLIITKIVTENFKSYFGRRILGPFHKNFTAILGPNGSGKSNVIDALLFVFGFRATRIRSKKVSSLIHTSAKNLDVQFCKVEVFFSKIIDRDPPPKTPKTQEELDEEFDNEDTLVTVEKAIYGDAPLGPHGLRREFFDLVPDSEFSVSRTATKNGSSNYHIDGKPATTADVQARLTENGIDLDHNRFLILQGEVEQIALMKPKGDERLGTEGMLEYLEDIVGSSRFKEPLAKLRGKLDWFGQQEDAIQRDLDFADMEVDILVVPAFEIVGMMKLENAIAKTTHKLLCRRRVNLEHRHKEAVKNCAEKDAGVRQTQEALAKAEADYKTASKQKAELQKKSDRTQQDIENAGQDARRLVSEFRRATDRIRALAKKIEAKELEIAEEENKLDAARNAPARAEEQLAELQAAIEQKQTEIAELEVEMRELRKQEREENAENRRQLDELMPQVAVMKAEEEKCFNEMAPVKDRLQRLEMAGTNVQQRFEEAEKRSKKVNEDLDQTQSELHALDQEIPDLRSQVESGEAELREIREREHALVQEFNGLNSELQSHRNKAEGHRTQSNALMALTQEHANGKLDGLLGRLGDLGGIDGRYDVAISTCCPALDNVVVETVECAQECIQFLKQRAMPRMTFIALDKQQHYWNNISNRPEIPAGSQRLIDLIAVTDEKVKPAFYSALHDTLVVDTIQTATSVSDFNGRRWRVVTLRGDVIESSGTMAGGGRREKRGLMGKQPLADISQRTTAAAELRQMEEQIGEKREQLNRLRSELSSKTAGLQSKRDELNQLLHNHRLLDQRLKVFEHQQREATTQMERAKQAMDSLSVDEVAIRTSQIQLNQLERQKESIAQRSAQVLKKKDELEAKIHAVEERLLGASQSALKKLKDELKTAEESLSTEKLVITNSGANIRKLEVSIERTRKLIDQTRRELEAAEAAIDRQQAAKQQNADRKLELERSFVQLTEELGQRVEDIASLEEQIVEHRRAFRDHKAAVEEVAKERDEVGVKLELIKRELGKLQVLQVREDIPPFLHAAMEQRLKEEEEDADEDEPIDAEPVDGDDANESRARAPRRPIAALIAAFDFGDLVEAADLPHTSVQPEADDELPYDPAYDSVAIPAPSETEIRAFDKDELAARLKRLQAKKAKLTAQMHLQTLEEFGEKMDKRNLVTAQMHELREAKSEHRHVFDRLQTERSAEFMAGFQKIRVQTQEIYRLLTMGGDAALETVDTLDPFKDGVCFQVRPPKKTWKQITNLSGGEKTLASLSLVFGLHNFRPTPLYVMDEIDAALDYRNVSIIGNFIRERTKNAQFIVISLRHNMFELADRLVGVYKVNERTFTLATDPEGVAVEQATTSSQDPTKKKTKNWFDFSSDESGSESRQDGEDSEDSSDESGEDDDESGDDLEDDEDNSDDSSEGSEDEAPAAKRRR